MSTTLVEKQQALDAARREASEFYAANPTDKIASDADLTEKATQHNRKMADLHDEVAKIQGIEKGAEMASAKRESAGRTVTEDDGEVKTSGRKTFDADEAWENSEGLAALKAKGVDKFKGTVELVEYPSIKTLLTLTTLSPQASRRPGIVGMALDETTVGDLVLQGTTDANTLTYFEETTVTNAAATVAEGDTKPESALAFTERTDVVRKIATWIPATSEFLEDNAGIRSYIDGRLRFLVEREEEDQLLNGDGTAPNISGILDRSIQSVTSSNDLDAIYHAITEVRVDGQAEPTNVVIHPLSWQGLRLKKHSTDEYYGPGPFSPDTAERIWGLPVRVTPLIAEGTALVGAFRPFAQIFRKGGIRVVASTEHSTYFTENKVAILAEERLAFAVYRPSAFCKVTGLASS